MEAQDTNEGPYHCDNGNCQNTPSCSRLSSPTPKRLCLGSVRVAGKRGESPAVVVSGLLLFIVIELLWLCCMLFFS